MKPFCYNTFVLLSLLLLASCGSGGKTDAKIEVSHTFSAADFSGGLIVIGSNASLGKKISIALDASLSKTVELEKGLWTFAAVGWDGASKFAGNKLCGNTSIDLSTDSGTVELTVNAANCTAAFDATMGFKDMMITSCGILKKYNGATDTFSEPLNTGADDTFCDSVPEEYQPSYTHYRIFAVNFYNNASSLGFASNCSTLKTPSRHTLPTLLMPFVVRTYKSLIDCGAQTPRSQAFSFPQGFAVGNSAVFDSKYLPTLSPNSARLSLASSMTRRGYSPFMSMVPRMTCSGNDCLPDPTSGLSDFHARWNPGNDDGGKGATLLRNSGLADGNCPATFLSEMDYFGLHNCKVEDGTIKGSFARNQFSCQDTNQMITGVIDIVHKNKKIYLLHSNRVDIYTNNGKFLKSASLTSGGYTHLAVNESEDLFITHSASISKVSYNGSNYLAEVTNFIGGPFNEIEAHGGLVYATNSNFLNTFDKGTGSFIMTSANAFEYDVKELIYVAGNVYLLSGTTGNFKMNRYPVSETGVIGTLVVIFSQGNAVTSLAYDNGKFYIHYGSSSYPYDLNFTLLTGTVSAASLSTANKFVMNKNHMVQITNANNIAAGRDNGATIVSTNLTNVCSESPAWTVKAGNFDLHTQREDGTYQLFEDFLDFYGTRKFADPRALTYFHSQADHGDDEGSRTGGRLGDVQQMLGPQGIGSFFSDFATCELLRNSLTVGVPLTRTILLKEPGTLQQMSITAEALKPAAASPIPLPMCDGADPTGGACIYTNYDLIITFSGVDNDGRKEKAKMNLVCGTKIGRFERVENDSGEIRRVTFHYSTDSEPDQRYEEYSREVKPGDDYVSVTKVMKEATTFWGKTADARFNSYGINSHTRETHLDVTNNRYVTSAYNISDPVMMNFPAAHSPSFDNVRDNQSFASLSFFATACMTDVNNDVLAVNLASCNTFPIPAIVENSTTAGIFVNPISLYNNKATTFTYGGVGSVFTLPAP